MAWIVVVLNDHEYNMILRCYKYVSTFSYFLVTHFISCFSIKLNLSNLWLLGLGCLLSQFDYKQWDLRGNHSLSPERLWAFTTTQLLARTFLGRT